MVKSRSLNIIEGGERFIDALPKTIWSTKAYARKAGVRTVKSYKKNNSKAHEYSNLGEHNPLVCAK